MHPTQLSGCHETSIEPRVDCRSRFISRHPNVDFPKSTYRGPSKRLGDPNPTEDDTSVHPTQLSGCHEMSIEPRVDCRSRFISRHPNVDFPKSTYRGPSKRLGDPNPTEDDTSVHPTQLSGCHEMSIEPRVDCRSRFISRHPNVDFGKLTYRGPSKRLEDPNPTEDDTSVHPTQLSGCHETSIEPRVDCRSRFISRHPNVDFPKSTYRGPSKRLGDPTSTEDDTSVHPNQLCQQNLVSL